MRLALVAAAFNAALAALVLAVVLTAAPARAHDPYSEWRVPNNPSVSCCHGNDCRPTRAYFGDDGLWWAHDGRAYVPVPPERLLPKDLAKDGRSHICEKAGWIYCFSPGETRS